MTPALTTVRQPLAEMGRMAASVLLRPLANRRVEPLGIELETRLVVRDSTADVTAVRQRLAHETLFVAFVKSPSRTSTAGSDTDAGDPVCQRRSKPLPRSLT